MLLVLALHAMLSVVISMHSELFSPKCSTKSLSELAVHIVCGCEIMTIDKNLIMIAEDMLNCANCVGKIR